MVLRGYCDRRHVDGSVPECVEFAHPGGGASLPSEGARGLPTGAQVPAGGVVRQRPVRETGGTPALEARLLGSILVKSSAKGLPPDEPVLSLAAVAREHITRTLELVDGNKAVAARLLGVSRRALYRQMERHGLHHRVPARRGGADPARPQ